MDTPLPSLRYLGGYPEATRQRVRELIAQDRLAGYLARRYPDRHPVQNDKTLHAYIGAIKQDHLRNAPPIDKSMYDGRLDLTHQALGLHSAVSRVQGGRLKAKKEIRIAALFKDAAPEFLRMIVVHELAHLKESEHNKAFYQLCEHIEPDYHQYEFDLRLLLTLRDLEAEARRKTTAEPAARS